MPRVTTSELMAVVWAQLELLRAQLLVWRRPIGQLIARPGRAEQTRVGQILSERRATSIATALDRAARRGIFRPKCLVRAIALHRMLEHSGVHGSVIRIGVRREGDELLAHAWVEHMGITLVDSPSSVARFSRLAETRLADTPASSR
jgi:hypothetical protein